MKIDSSAVAHDFVDQFVYFPVPPDPKNPNAPNTRGAIPEDGIAVHAMAIRQLIGLCMEDSDQIASCGPRYVLNALVETYGIDLKTLVVFSANEYKYKALDFCLHIGNLEMAAWLIEDHDVDVDYLMPVEFKTVLGMAVSRGVSPDGVVDKVTVDKTKHLARLMIAKGARLIPDTKRLAFSVEPPLFSAAVYGAKEIVEFLLDSGADVNIVSDKRTVLDHAMYYIEHSAIPEDVYRYGVYKFLISRGAKHSDGSNMVPSADKIEKFEAALALAVAELGGA